VFNNSLVTVCSEFYLVAEFPVCICDVFNLSQVETKITAPAFSVLKLGVPQIFDFEILIFNRVSHKIVHSPFIQGLFVLSCYLEPLSFYAAYFVSLFAALLELDLSTAARKIKQLSFAELSMYIPIFWSKNNVGVPHRILDPLRKKLIIEISMGQSALLV
jgi:hypothetical protein